jgi:hypothetical protein
VAIKPTYGLPADPAGQAQAAENRNFVATGNADPARKEQQKRWRLTEAAKTVFENAGVFEKKVALFREKQTESRQVDLFVVDFHLGEIGIQRQVEQKPRTRQIVHTVKIAGFTHTGKAFIVTRPGAPQHLFVFMTDHTIDIESPWFIFYARRIPERAKRNGKLRRPALQNAFRLNPPYRAPVDIKSLPLVANQRLEFGAVRIGGKDNSIPVFFQEYPAFGQHRSLRIQSAPFSEQNPFAATVQRPAEWSPHSAQKPLSSKA